MVDAATTWVDPELKASVRLVPLPDRGVDLHFRVHGKSAHDGGSMFALWQVDLASGVIAERLGRSGDNLADAVHGVTAIFIDRHGAEHPMSVDVGDIQPGQLFGDRTAADPQLIARLRAVSQDFGVEPRRIRILRPMDAAAVVVVRMPTIDALDKRVTALQLALLGSPPRFEGMYLEVQAPDGEPVVKMSSAFRSGAGSLWLAPRYGDRGGVAHG